jgi:hypothetical protein
MLEATPSCRMRGGRGCGGRGKPRVTADEANATRTQVINLSDLYSVERVDKGQEHDQNSLHTLIVLHGKVRTAPTPHTARRALLTAALGAERDEPRRVHVDL